MSMLSPKTIGQHYTLSHVIGQGGMGEVFLGQDTRTGEQVAIKRLKREVIESEPELLERFEREGQALRKVNHPSIVKMLAAFEENGAHYLVMEYVSGGSLRDLLQEQPQLSVERTLEIALDLADALTRAHRLKIIHRDIKPPNVLLAEDGTPRLTDFGVARLDERTRMTETGSLIGTYAYLSPEMCNSEPSDERTDIWSFGVMLYEMLAGQRPFTGSQPAAVILSIITKPMPNLAAVRPDVPPVLVNLISRMLEKERDDRIASMRLVGAELEMILRWNKRDSQAIALAQGIPTEVAEPSGRFATPTPSEISKVAEQTRSLISETSIAGLDAYLDTPATPFKEQSTTGFHSALPVPSAPPRNPTGIIIGVMLTFALLGALSFFLFYGQPSAQREQPSAEQADSVAEMPSVPPVAPGEYMVLVGEIEPIGVAQRPVTRFIIEDLRRHLEEDLPFSNYRVRAYPVQITSEEEARAAAQATGATVIVWGFYDAEAVTLHVQAGIDDDFSTFEVDPALVRLTADVDVRLTNERRQSIAPQVIAVNQVLATARGETFTLGRNIALLEMLGAQSGDIPGNSTADYVHRYFLNFSAQTEQALSEMDAALQRDASNPFIYLFRSSALYRLGRIEEARQDVETAVRLRPDWVFLNVPQGNDAFFYQADYAQSSEIYSIYLEQYPQDWVILTFRGAAYYLGRDYTRARADFEQAIALDPEASWPYLFAVVLAWREGRVEEAQAYIQTILAEFPDPAFANRFVSSFYSEEAARYIGNLFAAGGNLLLGRYEPALEAATAAIAVNDQMADLHFIQGVSLCNLNQLVEAEAAYSRAIALEPEEPLFYLVRASARRDLNDTSGAAQDISTALSLNPPAGLSDLIQAGMRGDVNCQTLFSYQPG